MADNTRMIPRYVNVGSPSTQVAFPQRVNSISIDNLSSVGVFANTDAGPNSGSITLGSCIYVAGGDTYSMNVVCGSLTFCASGTYASGVQIVGLG